MILEFENCKLGDKYRFHIKNGRLQRTSTDNLINGTIIGIGKKYQKIMLGWENCASPIISQNNITYKKIGDWYFEYNFVDNIKKFNYYWCFNMDNLFPKLEVKEIELPIILIDDKGSVCKRCFDFNQYAISNQNDGSFLCFSCR